MKPIRMRVPKKLAVITAQSYSTVEWPQLSSSLYRLLTNPNCAFPADNLYNLVYKICMAGLMDTCYQDLRQFIADHLNQMRQTLLDATPEKFYLLLAELVSNYRIALEKMTIVFAYLERQYVTKQLKISLSQELERELGDRVLQSVDVHERLKQLLPRTWPDMWKSLPSALIRHSPSHWTKQKTFPRDAILLSPSVLQPICECLFQFESQYAVYNPALFAMYIPGLVPDQGLAKEREATQHFFANYSKAFGSRASNKRKYSPL